MDFLTPTQRMNQALTEKRIQKKVLADAIGVPATTLNSWINRGGDFPASYVVPVAECLGVHPLWLLTGSDLPTPSIPASYVELKDDELFLLESFRALDQEGKIKYSWPEDNRNRLTMMGKFDHVREIERHTAEIYEPHKDEIQDELKKYRQMEQFTVKAPSKQKA